jgi:hypothetical protein
MKLCYLLTLIITAIPFGLRGSEIDNVKNEIFLWFNLCGGLNCKLSASPQKKLYTSQKKYFLH